MTRVVVVADRGEDFASLTAAVGRLPGACLVRHGSGAAPLDRMVGAIAPDLVVIGALRTGDRSVARLAEVRRAAPAARVVVLSSARGDRRTRRRTPRRGRRRTRRRGHAVTHQGRSRMRALIVTDNPLSASAIHRAMRDVSIRAVVGGYVNASRPCTGHGRADRARRRDRRRDGHARERAGAHRRDPRARWSTSRSSCSRPRWTSAGWPRPPPPASTPRSARPRRPSASAPSCARSWRATSITRSPSRRPSRSPRGPPA